MNIKDLFDSRRRYKGNLERGSLFRYILLRYILLRYILLRYILLRYISGFLQRSPLFRSDSLFYYSLFCKKKEMI